MESLVFLAGLSALVVHELDAIQQQEWRFFFGWMGMSDQQAYQVFTAAHFPLLLLILALLPDPGFQRGLDIFLVLHALAHFLLRKHRLIRFNSPFSGLWIYGGAAAGLAHLLMISG